MNLEETGHETNRLKSLTKDFASDIVVLLFLLGVRISSLPINSFEFAKACLVDLNINETTCEDIVYRSVVRGHEQDYSKVEKLFTSIEVWMSVVRNAVPACLILFAGAFSDKSGRRKFFILLPLVFEIVSYIGLILVEIDFYGTGLLIVGIIRCVPGFSGGSSIMLMAVFSHIGDITDEESRTARIGRLTVVVLASQPIGSLLIPLFSIPGKTYPAVLSSLTLFATSLVIGCVFISDKSLKPLPDKFIIEFFKPDSIVSVFKLLFKKRSNNARWIILSIVIICVFSTCFSSGENKVVYQYLKRSFALSDAAIAYYFTYSIIILFIGTTLLLNVFIKKNHIEDYVVGLIGDLNKVFVNAGYALVKTSTALYIVTLFDIFTGCSSIGMRSIASKSVETEELGKLFAIFGFIDLAAAPVSAIIYGYFYTYTREIFTGAFFLLSYLFIIPICALFLFIKCIQKKGKVRNVDKSLNDENNESVILKTTKNNLESNEEDKINGCNNLTFEVSEKEHQNIDDIRL